jgi:hypothetical protein
MRVEHVTVNEGGQAIVGNVTTGGRGPRKKRDQPHEKGISLPKRSAVLGNLEAHGRTVQGSRGAGLERVSLPRCAWRWTSTASISCSRW